MRQAAGNDNSLLRPALLVALLIHGLVLVWPWRFSPSSPALEESLTVLLKIKEEIGESAVSGAEPPAKTETQPETQREANLEQKPVPTAEPRPKVEPKIRTGITPEDQKLETDALRSPVEKIHRKQSEREEEEAVPASADSPPSAPAENTLAEHEEEPAFNHSPSVVAEKDRGEPDRNTPLLSAETEQPTGPETADLPPLSKKGGRTPNTTDASHPFSSYLQVVVARINSVKRYPRFARLRGIEGRVTLEFVLLGDGRLEKFMITGSSGYAVLDEEAVATLRRAAPFPPVPEKTVDDRIKMTITIVFELKND